MMADYEAAVLVMRRWIKKILLIGLLISGVGAAASCSKGSSETIQLETAETESENAGDEEELREATRESPIKAQNNTVPLEVTQIITENQVIEVTSTSSPAPEKPKEMVICISEEPQSLYLYSQSKPSISMRHIFSAIYEPLYTTLSYDYQPVGLVRIPNLSGSDALIKEVEVNAGDTVLDVFGSVVVLKNGIKVRTSDGVETTFQEDPLLMEQMVVTFELKPMTWSDGTPVSAEDSVYSYELASDPATPIPKHSIDRTADYRALDERTIEWTGVPGFLDRQYFTNVWQPLPRHAWQDISAEELLEASISNTDPLSYGPFAIQTWTPGESISFVANEFYYFEDQDLPYIDELLIRFIPNEELALTQLLSGDCDLITDDLTSVSDIQALLDAEEKGLIRPYFEPGIVFEHIDFGINPVEDYLTERPDWFEDARVRQAFLMCTDRQSIHDDLLSGKSQLINAYIPDDHPLFPEDAVIWPYDVAAANDLLDQVGYVDSDEDGLRNDPRLGGEFVVDIYTAIGNEMGLKIAEAFSEDMADCGVAVSVKPIDSDLFFSDGPEGPLFGRRFDLAEFPWLISIEPNCALYLSSRVPGDENNWNRTFNNETGFSSSDFDEACASALQSLPGTDEFAEHHQEALRHWTEQLPIIPLFMRLKIAASHPGVEGLSLNATQESDLWNLAKIDINREKE